MKKILLSFLLGCAATPSFAEVVSPTRAEAVASRFFSSNQSLSLTPRTAPLHLVWSENATQASQAEAPAFYVFNRGKQEGFVIVAGDDAVCPILAYSYKGTFNVKNLPDNLKGWMHQQQRNVEEVRRHGILPSDEIKNKWSLSAENPNGTVLITPEWNQQDPYNAKCPGIPEWNWHSYTGCTITATAIVMGYHQWPDCGVGQLKGYYTSGLEMNVPGITLGHPYLWDKMPEINGNVLDYADEEQRDAVSTLMRDLGVMLKARYDYAETSADISLVPFKIVRHMKYDEGVMYLKKEHFSNGLWEKIMKDEIDAHRPILYAGYGTTSGHAFVLDGYDAEGLFSVNWGWGGVSNGFFKLSGLDPSQQGAGGSADGSGFSGQQEAVIRMQPVRPEGSFEPEEKMVFICKSVSGSAADAGLRTADEVSEIAQGRSFTVSAGAFLNFGSRTFEGGLKLAITDAAGNLKEVLYSTPGTRYMAPGNVMMPLDEARDFVSVSPELPIEKGDRIRLLFPSKDGSWKPVVSDEPEVPWEIVLDGNEQTGIDNIGLSDEDCVTTYDLAGRRVKKVVRGGIYLRKGQIFIGK